MKRTAKDLSSDANVLLFFFCFVFFFVFCFLLSFFLKLYVVGTHLNCIDKSLQFKWVPTTYAFIKK